MPVEFKKDCGAVFLCGLRLLWQENCTAGKVSFYDLKVIVKQIIQYRDMTAENQNKGARNDGH